MEILYRVGKKDEARAEFEILRELAGRADLDSPPLLRLEPIAREFETTFADLSYGNDPRRALFGLLQRVPSVSVTALITAVMVQRETGGNLAENLAKISSVIRGRFRFQRRVKTLSAEGRLSGWILALTPLVLFGALWAMHPEYVARLTEHPRGPTLIIAASTLGVVGILWIRRLVRIEV